MTDASRPLFLVGAAAFVVATAMTLPIVFSIQPLTDPGHNRDWALAANSASYRLGWTLRVYAIAPIVLGMMALYQALSRTRASRLSLVAIVVTVLSAAVFLPGMGYPVVVIPAAGSLIAGGGGVDRVVLDLLDRVFEEPAWIPVFFAGFTYQLGWLLMGAALWKSGLTPRIAGPLAMIAALVAIPAYLDVPIQTPASLAAAAATATLAVVLFRMAHRQQPV
jgi:hypothetical protein